jgi:pyridoxine kinase
MSHAPVPQHHRKVALVNDISGYGHCSTAVALPIISWLGIQCCPVPTAILSNHTGYSSCWFDDYTDNMPSYLNEWKKLGLRFDGIETGFLGSARQIQIVRSMIKDFRTTETIVLVDPVMGDHGAIYRTYTDEMCREMKSLVALADIVTPNLTEACILADIHQYHENFSRKDLTDIAEKISSLGPSHVVITGIQQGEFIANFTYERSCYTKEDNISSSSSIPSGTSDSSHSSAVIHNFRTHRINSQKCGTGDIFAAILTADAVNRVPFDQSVKRAGTFIKKCVEKTLEYNDDPNNGVCLEEMMPQLKRT